MRRHESARQGSAPLISDWFGPDREGGPESIFRSATAGIVALSPLRAQNSQAVLDGLDERGLRAHSRARFERWSASQTAVSAPRYAGASTAPPLLGVVP